MVKVTRVRKIVYKNAKLKEPKGTKDKWYANIMANCDCKLKAMTFDLDEG